MPQINGEKSGATQNRSVKAAEVKLWSRYSPRPLRAHSVLLNSQSAIADHSVMCASLILAGVKKAQIMKFRIRHCSISSAERSGCAQIRERINSWASPGLRWMQSLPHQAENAYTHS